LHLNDLIGIENLRLNNLYRFFLHPLNVTPGHPYTILS